jgi:hypothetical protein
MTDPYGSHITFLTSLGGDVSTVLELGSGLYSTPLFLNRDAFPKVTRVVSVEHNQVWADKVSTFCTDERLTLIVTPEPIEGYLATLTLDEFDLIFVDNSDGQDGRIKTIEYLGEKAARSKVVIHDFEHDFYRNAARNFPNKIVDTQHVPHTALVWK